MVDLDSLIIIIPARGGSKRVPLKNIAPLGGRPLLGYTIESALNAQLTKDLIVTTDSDEISQIAKKYPVRVVHRPPSLSGDTASTEEALIHALDELEKVGETFTWVMTLPPTSPFRTSLTLKRFVDSVGQLPCGSDCFMSVTENRGYFWKMDPRGQLEPLDPQAPRRQQERSPLFEENSAIYLTRVESLRATGKIFGNSLSGIPLSNIEAWDINTIDDFKIAEAILKSLPLET